MTKQIKTVQLQVNIFQKNETDQRNLELKDKFTIGRDRGNDIVLYGEEFPKKHVLFAREGNHFVIAVQSYMHGEIRVNDSRLNFVDLIKHSLIARRGDSYILRVSPGKQGVVTIDSIRIEFACDTKTVTVLPPEAEFSWFRAWLKNSAQDPLFKFVFLSLLIITGLFISRIAGMEIPERKPLDLEKVEQRFTRFLVETRAEPMIESDRGTSALPTESSAQQEETSEQPRNERAERSTSGSSERRPQPITTQGLLGLISGSGESERGGSIMDALMDAGLVHELEEVAGETNLKVGRKDGSPTAEGDGLQELLDATASGGIDDLLSGLDEAVPTIALEKEGQVEVARASNIRESAEIIGRRDESSLRAVINQHKPRINYIYNKYLKRDPNLEGKITIEIHIAASGRVERVVVLEDTIGNREFTNELTNTIRQRWRFNPIERGTVIANYPFVFIRPN